MKERFEDLRARDVMQPPVAIEGRASLRAAAERMWETGADTLLVLADDGALVGLLSERDLVFGAEAEALGIAGTVADHARSPYLDARTEERLVDIIDRMAADAARIVLVTGGDGEPVGIFSLFSRPRVPGEEVAELDPRSVQTTPEGARLPAP